MTFDILLLNIAVIKDIADILFIFIIMVITDILFIAIIMVIADIINSKFKALNHK